MIVGLRYAELNESDWKNKTCGLYSISDPNIVGSNLTSIRPKWPLIRQFQTIYTFWNPKVFLLIFCEHCGDHFDVGSRRSDNRLMMTHVFNIVEWSLTQVYHHWIFLATIFRAYMVSYKDWHYTYPYIYLKQGLRRHWIFPFDSCIYQE